VRHRKASILEIVTDLLEKVIKRIEALPESDQDAFACQTMEMLDEDEAWDRSLRANPEKSQALADEALEEYQRGNCTPMGELVADDAPLPTAASVRVSHDEIVVNLSDGRTISVPLVWFPRLAHGTEVERPNLTLIGRGEGIHWPDLDEDISVKGLLAGRRSDESQESLRRWLERRKH